MFPSVPGIVFRIFDPQSELRTKKSANADFEMEGGDLNYPEFAKYRKVDLRVVCEK